MYLQIKWQKTEGGARLLRVKGSTKELVLPEEIEGNPITEIGNYCFSEKEVAAFGEVFETSIGKEQEVHEICGAYLERLTLPDTVRRIGNCAFYNCTKLREIVFGANLKEIGSDAFMNCRNLHALSVRAGVREQTGLRQMLAQLSGGMTVFFQKGEKCEACVLYPEYYEAYDEISPAHIFGRKIEGEGFRARQCFQDGVLDFLGYDGIFPKACAEETAEICMQLALNRLRYPVDLREEKKERYERYVMENAGSEAVTFLRKRDKETLFFLCEQKYLSKQDVEELIKKAAEADWAEGAASLMQWKAKFYREEKTNRYSFEEF